MFGSMPSALVVASAGVIAPTATVVQQASAQNWQFAGWSESDEDMYGFGFMMGGTAPITARDLRMYTDVLGLDDMQMEIMREAFDDFSRSYNYEWVLFSEARSDAQNASEASDDWQKVQEQYTSLKETFDEKVDRLEEQFIGDLRLVLSGEQLEKWDLLEREQRRAKTLAKYASYPDEKVDIVACVQALELSDETKRELETILEDYRTQMDLVLVSRNRKADQVGKRAMAADEIEIDYESIDYENPVAMEAAYAEYNKAREQLVPLGLELRQACARVREVNVQFRRRVEERLPADQIEEFTKIARPKPESDMWSMMYGGYSRAKMMIGLLENIEMYIASAQMQADMWGESDNDEMAIYLRRMREVQPLTESQRQQLAQIKADYEAGSESIRARYATKKTDSQTDDDPDYIQMPTPHGTLSLRRVTEGEEEEAVYGGMYGGMYGMGGEEPNMEQQREQSELDQQIIDRLRAIMTIEQRALMAMM
jgi:hypothetical protein